ncbi:hypothetical protein DSCOOX_04050 [Desulfosarcina ovata subsp. ovata]|uniref:CRISPR-associated endoribonuclease Cas2 n=1 Tax=Desulfosarcina ovata subsp. ovata TaxID=2752305 RepID=A0A5K8A3V3_9BACT|nr:hypothetical protein DSCOOX_04050 [Desulfosarcina ovata subsp. ovata]
MSRPGKKWYLIAYDIRNEKRLRRLHYYLKKRAVALQKSVFLLRANTAQLKEVEGQIKIRIDDREDDVRRYPIYGPNAIWGAGMQAAALESLYTRSSGKSSKSGGLEGLFRKIFKRKRP